MSIALIERELKRFLSTEEPEAMSFSGRWGVGKTFAWNRFVKDMHGKIALKNYSYVSLFGVNSLDELKYSIFENSVGSSAVGLEPSLETLKSNTTEIAKQFGKRSLWFIQQLPKVKSYVTGLGPIWFLAVKRMVICLDDVERHGKDLSVRDILGLVSLLKEQKHCKVVLILNDEALQEAHDKKDFETYLEKVVDSIVRFTPSPAESVQIALSAVSDANKVLAESCVALGISNIRLIKRIERAVLKIGLLLDDFDPGVLRQAVQSLALLGWSVYEPNRAPPVAYLQSRAAHLFGPKGQEPVGENEAEWNAVLDAFGFFSFDEFDLVLLDGTRNGFFDQIQVRKHGAELDAKLKNAHSRGALEEAWGVFHDSFADNEDDVIETIYQTVLNNLPNLNILDLNAVMWLFKGLDRRDRAIEIVDRYVADKADRRFYDLNNYPFRDHIDDPDLRRIFAERYSACEEQEHRQPEAILLSIAEKRGWSPEDLQFLAGISVDEYYRMFKTQTGDELHQTIKACLQFGTFGDPTGAMNRISHRATEALQRIGSESRINALRLRKHGVDPGEQSGTP
jgi:AraC-like DNA-binding protein